MPRSWCTVDRSENGEVAAGIDPDIGRLVTPQLAELDCESRLIADGVTALAEAEAGHYDLVIHRSGLAQMFPREAGFEALLGMPIIAGDGRLLGHLAFFNKAPLGDEMLVDSVYRIFLARAAAELERIQALARLGQV